MNYIDFFKNFLKDKNIGALAPSSSFTIQRICRKIDFTKKNIIVEFGPGPGVISGALLKKMTNDSKLILVETNPVFYEQLCAIDDPRLFVFNLSATEVLGVVRACRETSVDYVISGIPFSFFDDHKKKDILEKTYASLKKGGKLIVYQYSLLIKKYLNRYFGPLRCEIEFLNFMPLFIIEGIKVETDPLS